MSSLACTDWNGSPRAQVVAASVPVLSGLGSNTVTLKVHVVPQGVAKKCTDGFGSPVGLLLRV